MIIPILVVSIILVFLFLATYKFPQSFLIIEEQQEEPPYNMPTNVEDEMPSQADVDIIPYEKKDKTFSRI